MVYLANFLDELRKASQDRGTPLDVAPRLPGLLRKTGFVIKFQEVRRLSMRENRDLERRRFKAFAEGLLAADPVDVIVQAALAADQLLDDDHATL